jgi:hypothetical protein
VSWLRVDDGFTDHPKVLALSDGAFRLHMRAMCWVARQETDGALPSAALRSLHPKSKHVDELVASKLWETTDAGHAIHDYLTYNPSKAKLEAERSATRERVQRFRNGVTDRESGTHKTAPVTPLQTRITPPPCNASPVPSRPVPIPSQKKNSCQAGPDVHEVFDFWKRDTGKTKAVLDAKRAARIASRIREGATVDELKQAIRNRRNDQFLMGSGTNSSGVVYDGIETLLRDRAQFERLFALNSPPVPKGPPPGLQQHAQFGGRTQEGPPREFDAMATAKRINAEQQAKREEDQRRRDAANALRLANDGR